MVAVWLAVWAAGVILVHAGRAAVPSLVARLRQAVEPWLRDVWGWLVYRAPGAAAGVLWRGLRRLARTGLGGAAGSGGQYVSWVHHVDFVRAIDFLIAHPA